MYDGVGGAGLGAVVLLLERPAEPGALAGDEAQRRAEGDGARRATHRILRLGAHREPHRAFASPPAARCARRAALTRLGSLRAALSTQAAAPRPEVALQSPRKRRDPVVVVYIRLGDDKRLLKSLNVISTRSVAL